MSREKTKEQKGITLVALIITIIVLLILAVVSIRAVTGEGIISKAKEARSEYEKGQTNESTTLDSDLAQLDDATKVKWTQNKTTVTNGEITVEVGDYVDYKANVSGYTDTNGWRVLGAENGELLLISSSNVVSSLTLSGAADYLNDVGIGKLNTACEPYKNAEYATKARSVNVDDINRVTGYDPTKTGNGKPYGSGEVRQYGNEVTYELVNGKVKYNGTESSQTTFKKPGESSNITEPYKVKSTYYSYYPNTLTSSSSGSTLGIDTSSNEYKAIFLKVDGTSKDTYWLGTSYAYAYEGGAYFGIRYVYNDRVYGVNLCGSNGGINGSGNGVRAAVSLKSNIKLKPNGANSWKISK